MISAVTHLALGAGASFCQQLDESSGGFQASGRLWCWGQSAEGSALLGLRIRTRRAGGLARKVSEQQKLESDPFFQAAGKHSILRKRP